MSKNKESLEVAAFRLPEWLREMAETRCHREDVTFSQLMRRAIRKEIGLETAAKPGEEVVEES